MNNSTYDKQIFRHKKTGNNVRLIASAMLTSKSMKQGVRCIVFTDRAGEFHMLPMSEFFDDYMSVSTVSVKVPQSVIPRGEIQADFTVDTVSYDGAFALINGRRWHLNRSRKPWKCCMTGVSIEPGNLAWAPYLNSEYHALRISAAELTKKYPRMKP